MQVKTCLLQNVLQFCEFCLPEALSEPYLFITNHKLFTGKKFEILSDQFTFSIYCKTRVFETPCLSWAVKYKKKFPTRLKVLIKIFRTSKKKTEIFKWLQNICSSDTKSLILNLQYL